MSPYRNFRDDEDQEWTAWDVIPSWGERRRGERRAMVGSSPPAGDRRSEERRRQRGIRIALTPRLAEGWLAFESNDERRRVVPIPAEWHTMAEDALRALWRDAELLPRRRRLIE